MTAELLRCARSVRLNLPEMAAFVRSDRCLMQRLISALDDPSAEPCGRCAVCCGPLVPVEVRAGSARAMRSSFSIEAAVQIAPRTRAPANLVAEWWNDDPGGAAAAAWFRALFRTGIRGTARWSPRVSGETDASPMTCLTRLPSLSAVRWDPQPAPTMGRVRAVAAASGLGA